MSESCTVTISRQRNYPTVALPGPAWRWVYSYSIDGNVAVEYGAGLQSLRRMLREKFGIASRAINEAWK